MKALADQISREAKAASLVLGDAASLRLAAYVQAVLEHNRHVNLTAARDLAQALEVLVRPSLAVRAAWQEPRGPERAVDIGSGNGFPGVAAAVIWPTCRVVLVERRAKKARAIESCLAEAGLTNTTVLACDAREIRAQRSALLGSTDLVTLRAVGALDETTRLAAPLLRAAGRIVHWKSVGLPRAERRAGAAAAAALGMMVLPDVPQPGGRGVLVIYTAGDLAP